MLGARFCENLCVRADCAGAVSGHVPKASEPRGLMLYCVIYLFFVRYFIIGGVVVVLFLPLALCYLYVTGPNAFSAAASWRGSVARPMDHATFVAEEDDDEVVSTIESRKMLSRQMTAPQAQVHKPQGNAPDVRQDIAPIDYDGATADQIAQSIDGAVEAAETERVRLARTELEERHMVKCNCQITLMLVLHRGLAATKCLMGVTASITFPELKNAIKQRIDGHFTEEVRLFKDSEDDAELDWSEWHVFVHDQWCTQPWVIHVRSASQGARIGSEIPAAVSGFARLLFSYYDVNGNGRIERRELKRVIEDLHLERVNCPPQLVTRFVEAEYQRLDVDNNGGVGLKEFESYVARMNRWMRNQLAAKLNQNEIFSMMAARAVIVCYPPTAIPTACDQGDSRGPVAIIDTGLFGIRLEVPLDALPSALGALPSEVKISMRTLTTGSVAYLAEEEGAPRVELPYSPAVRIDYPAFEAGSEPPELGGQVAPPFLKPLTLIMPHCFDPKEGEESCVLVGAPHGGTHWEYLHKVDDANDLSTDDLSLHGGEMRVNIPYVCGQSIKRPVL